MKYMIIRKSEYELLKKAVATNDEYVKFIKINNNELASIVDSTTSLSNDIKTTLEKLNLVEIARRKNASKIGGLTTSLNKEKNKTKELLDTVSELEGEIKLKQLEIEKKDVQNKILKNAGKQKQLDDYQKLVELNKDIQKHKRNK